MRLYWRSKTYKALIEVTYLPLDCNGGDRLRRMYSRSKDFPRGCSLGHKLTTSLLYRSQIYHGAVLEVIDLHKAVVEVTDLPLNSR